MSATIATCLACPRDGANACEGEARDVLRQPGHLLTTEGQAREKTREDRVTVAVGKALTLGAEDARPHAVIASPWAEEPAPDCHHTAGGGAPLPPAHCAQRGAG